MIKKGFVITVIFIVNTLIQLISQIVVARIFGATIDLDIFLAAVAIPTVIVTVMYGTLNDAFLPLFAKKRVESQEKADSYFLSHLLILGSVSLGVALLMSLFAKQLSFLLYAYRGESFVQNVAIQMQIMFLAIPLSFIATLFGSYLYAHKKFVRFPAAQAIGSISNLLLIILLAPSMGVWSMVVAFVVNIAIQILFIIPFKKISLSFEKVSVWPLILVWVPLIISSFAARSDTVFVRSFASRLPDGYLVYLNLTSKMFSLATGVATIAIQILLFPHLVEYIAQKNFQKAYRIVDRAKIIAILISTAVAGVVMLIAPYLIHLLFIGGKFSQHDAAIAITLLPIFFVPSIGLGVNNVFFQPLMAINKQLHLAAINIAAVLLGWGGGMLIQSVHGTFQGLTFGLIIFVFSGIIGSEIVWQIEKRKIHLQSPSSSVR